MKHFVALLAAAAVLAAVLVGPTAAPASAEPPNLGEIDFSRASANVGTDVAVTPRAPCPEGSTQASLTYATNPIGTVVDSVSVALDEQLGWIDTVRPDAGAYVVSVTCQGPSTQSNAGHLAARGIQLITTGTYDDGYFEVDGIITATPNPAIFGGNITLSTAVDSACHPGGGIISGAAFFLVYGPDDAFVLALPSASAELSLAADGTFSATVPIGRFVYPDGNPALGSTFVPTPPGTYTISGTCMRSTVSPDAPSPPVRPEPTDLTPYFHYSGSFEVVASPAATPDVAADAVTATPTFTG